MSELPQLKFKASAHLQRLIGRELFRNDDLAVLELVKNAYDSGASLVEITIQPTTEKIPSEIVVRDNGSGMTLETFKKTFMFAGFSIRASEIGKSKRVPTGEKGIGRFASDRLGSSLSVVTKTAEDSKALLVNIDWTLFDDRRKEFNEVTVPYRYGLANDLIDSDKGTTLRISKVRHDWNRSRISSLRRTLGDLLNPYESPKNFAIELVVLGSAAQSGPVTQSPITSADLELGIKVDRYGNVSRRIRGTEHSLAYGGEWTQISKVLPDLAGITGRLLYFYKRPGRVQTAGLEAGVRLYRDGFRIEPFGSSSADWLGVAEKRAKRAGHAHIVPTRLFGFISFSRVRNPELVDTTSREALIDTPASRGLITLLKDQLSTLEEIIQSEIAEPRWEENQERKQADLEQGRLQALSLMSYGLAHELRQPLQVISLEVGNISTRLEQLGIKDVEIIESQVSIEEGLARIDQNIRTIASLTTGDLGDSSPVDLVMIVGDTCSYVEARCAAAGIELKCELPDEQSAFLNEKMLRMVLLNLLQNAIDALSEVAGRNRELVVTLDMHLHKHRIRVRDNADGIPESMRPKIFTNFNTGKTGGMGLGLYLCHSLLTAAKGEISFSTFEGVGTTFTVVIPDSEE